MGHGAIHGLGQPQQTRTLYYLDITSHVTKSSISFDETAWGLPEVVHSSRSRMASAPTAPSGYPTGTTWPSRLGIAPPTPSVRCRVPPVMSDVLGSYFTLRNSSKCRASSNDAESAMGCWEPPHAHGESVAIPPWADRQCSYRYLT